MKSLVQNYVYHLYLDPARNDSEIASAQSLTEMLGSDSLASRPTSVWTLRLARVVLKIQDWTPKT